jgi:plastocyanin
MWVWPRARGVPLAAALFLAASLAGASPTTSGAGSRSAPARVNVDVDVGLDPQQLPEGVSPQSLAFASFPRAVRIHAGDTVTWHFRARSLTTVTFPGTPSPHLVEFTGSGEPKVAPVKDAAGYPFWFVGRWPQWVVPTTTLLPQGGPTISSPGQIRSSGLARTIVARQEAKDPAPYSLRFLRPGVYPYFDAARPGETGRVTVLAAGTPGESVAGQRRRGEAERRKVLSQLRALGAARPQAPLTVWIGNGRDRIVVASFVPRRLVVRRGQTVTFLPHGGDTHTVTFGPPSYTGEIARTLLTSRGVLNMLGVYPSEPIETRQPIVFDGRNHGNGFLSSSIFVGGSFLPSWRVRFTRAGTYRYADVFTPGMRGVIVVR